MSQPDRSGLFQNSIWQKNVRRKEKKKQKRQKMHMEFTIQFSIFVTHDENTYKI